MSDQETLQVYSDKAQEYADNFARSKPDRDLQAFIDGIPNGGSVLDFGCGPGNSAAMMNAAGLKAEATDACAEMVEMARDKFGVDARLATFNDLTEQDRYDGIWANFSLLHAPRADMPTHFANIKAALKPGGLLHLGLKLGKGEKRDRLGRLYTFFTQGELKNLLEAAGFEIEFTRKSSAKGLEGTAQPYTIIRARG